MIQHMFPIAIGAFVILYIYRIVRTFFTRKRVIREHGYRLPRAFPHRDPLLGLDGVVETFRAAKNKTFIEHQIQRHETYGATFSSRFFTSPVINTIEPENIMTVLSSKFKDYGIGPRRKEAFAPLAGESIFQVDPPQWEHSRNLLRPCFTKDLLEDLEALEGHVQNLINAIPSDGSMFDLGELFYRLTADITTDLVLAKSTASLLDPNSIDASFMKAFHNAQVGCEEGWRLGSFARLLPRTAFYQSIRKVHDFIDKQVESALESREDEKQKSDQPQSSESKRYVFLHALREITQDRKVLRDEITTIFVAGIDTPAALLTSLFFALAKRPDVWENVRREVEMLGGEKPSVNQLRGMEYIRWCIRESLRLYPVLPTNSRVAYKDTVLPVGGGSDQKAPLFVRKGTMVSYSTAALHQRKDLWGEDAEEFRPERWRNEKLSWKYIPFNGGPRNCIGEGFALTEVTYTVIRLAQAFERIESRDSGPWVEAIAMACISANGAKVVMVPA